jgi:hypothetical protein
MIFRDTRNGNYWQLDSCPSNPQDSNSETVAVFPLGGGFLHNIPRSELVETEFPTETIIGWATMDVEPYAYACIYNPHDRWNGWGQPYFTKAIIDKIVENWECYITPLETDKPIFRMSEDTGLTYDSYLVTQIGEEPDEDMSLYLTHRKDTDLWGFDGLCWDCQTQEELDEFGGRANVEYTYHQ